MRNGAVGHDENAQLGGISWGCLCIAADDSAGMPTLLLRHECPVLPAENRNSAMSLMCGVNIGCSSRDEVVALPVSHLRRGCNAVAREVIACETIICKPTWNRFTPCQT